MNRGAIRWMIVGLLVLSLAGASAQRVLGLRQSLSANESICHNVLRATASMMRPGSARSSLETGDLAAAIRNQASTTPPTRDMLGRLLNLDGQTQAALAIWRENGYGQIDRFDRAAEACAFRLGEPDEALKIAEVLIALDDQRPSSWRRYADIAFGLGRLADARLGYETVLSLQPGSAAVQLALGRTIQVLNSRDPAAISSLEAAHAADPTNVWTLYFLHISATESGDPASAQRWLVQADKLCRPGCPSAVLGGVRYAPERLHAELATALRAAGFISEAAWHEQRAERLRNGLTAT